MPRCYQVNYYPKGASRNASKTDSSREDWNLPEDSFVFTNFNKNDKIEPSVFFVWMNILLRVGFIGVYDRVFSTILGT